MGRGKLNGKMGNLTKANIKKIKNTGKEFLNGLMEENILGFGIMGNSMGLAFII